MSKNTKNAVAESIRRKVVKNGSRGTTLATLVTTARSIKSTSNKSTVRNILNKLEAYEVRPDVFSLSSNW